MNAEYHALHNAMTRINSTRTGNPMLPSPYKAEDADSVYQMMVELVPVGTRVRVTYIPSPDKPTEITTRVGRVSSHVPISADEPDFHIFFDDTNSTLLLPGSVLEAI